MRRWFWVVGIVSLLVGLSFGSSGGAGAVIPEDEARVYLSSTTGGTVGGITFADEDIVVHDSSTDSWTMLFDGSDVLPAGADVDGVAVLDGGVLALSFQAPVSIAGLGIVDDSDVVHFTSTSLGDTTAGTFSLSLDGSTVGLTTANEDITALIVEDDELTVSTLGGFNVPQSRGGNLTGADEDLITLDDPAWSLRFDGSDVGLATEDLWGASTNAFTGELYGASLNAFNVPGLTGDGDDVFEFTGTTGEATSGTFGLFWDGDDHGFGGEQIDGLHVEILAPPPPGEADLSITKTDDADPVLPGQLITYTVTVSNAGPDPAANVVVTDTLPAGVTLAATDGCEQDPTGLPCTLGNIPANGSAQYTITVQVDAGTAGLITNAAEVAAGTGDPNLGNNTTSEDTFVGSVPTATDDGPATDSVPGDPFHTAADTTLIAPAGTLLANDVVGDPAAVIVSFGGGSNPLENVTTHAAGSTAPFFDGSIRIEADGGFTFTPPTGFSGVFTVDYRLENVFSASDATLSIFVGERPEVDGGDKIYLSSTSFGTVDGIDFDDEDILVFDNELDSWELFFDGTDVLPPGADVNAFLIDKNDRLLMSFQNPVTLPGLGTIDDSDVVEFVATSLGEDTTGFFALYLDGTNFGLTTNAEDISAITIYRGDLTVSTAASFNVPKTGGGNILGRNEDLINTSGPGTWDLLFDGSDVDLAAEDIAGVSIDADSGDVYATSFNGYNVPGLSGDNNDVIVFSGTLGDPTSGTYSTFFDGDDHRFGQEQVDALHVVLNRNEPPVANPDRAATDENTPITIGPDATVSISGAGGEITKIAIDPRTGNYVVADVVDGVTRVRRYDPVNRRVLATASVPSAGPAGIDVDVRNGNIVVAENLGNTITVFDPMLTTVLDTETVAGIGAIGGVTVNPATGEVIVGGNGISRIYAPDFNSLRTVFHPDLVATGFDVDERNDEIVAALFEDQGSFGPGQIQRWDDEGDFLATIATADTNFPADLSVEQLTGDIAVPNFESQGNVTVFDENGNTESFLGGFGGPRGVAFDPVTGDLAVADGQGLLIDPTSGDLADLFLDRRRATLAVQPVSEEILTVADSGSSTVRRLATLDPTTRARLGVDERFVVDAATDPTTGRIAVLVGPAISSRVLEIYDPTGSTVLHSMTVPGASVAFNPDTGDVAVSLRTGEFRVYDPTLTTMLASFPLGSSNSLGVQPGTGNLVTLFGLSEVRIHDDTGAPIASIVPGTTVLDVAVDPATGNIAIGMPDRDTEIWDPTGTTLLDTIPAPMAGDGAAGVAYGGTGNLLIGYDDGGSLDVVVWGLLANDTDPDGDPLNITGFDATSANGAAVTVNPDGSFTYDPTGVPAIAALRAGETLADTFTYTIGDGNGETDTATATVFVAGVNDAPAIGEPAEVSVAEGTTAVADYDATDDTDSEGSGLTYSLIGSIDDEFFAIDPSTGVLAFLAPPDFELPRDEDGDNVYDILVNVIDTEGSASALDVRVTVTDTAEPGTITIIQDTQPDDATPFSFSYTPAVVSPGSFVLDDDGDTGNARSDRQFFGSVPLGTYTFAQAPVAATVLTDISCTGGTTSTDEQNRTATITITDSDDVTCTFATGPAADLQVAFAANGPDPVPPGDQFSYSFLVTNGPGGPAPNPVLMIDLPAEVSFVSSSSCTETSPGSLTCPLPSLGAGGAIGQNVIVTASSSADGRFLATASVTSDLPDPNPANNTVTAPVDIRVPRADLEIILIGPGEPIAVGETAIVAVLLSNLGPDDAENVQVIFDPPTGLSFDSASGTITCNPGTLGRTVCDLGTLAPGLDVGTFTAFLGADAEGDYFVSADVTTTTNDPGPGANSSVARVEVTSEE